MAASTSLSEQQTAKDPAVRGSGARQLDRELFLAIGFMVLGGLALLISLDLPSLTSLTLTGEIAKSLPDLAEIANLRMILFGAAVATLFVVFVWRLQAKHRMVYRTASGCPDCYERDFVRMNRRGRERAASKLLWLPTQRYACRGCGRQGLFVESRVTRIDSPAAVAENAYVPLTAGVSKRDVSPARATTAKPAERTVAADQNMAYTLPPAGGNKRDVPSGVELEKPQAEQAVVDSADKAEEPPAAEESKPADLTIAAEIEPEHDDFAVVGVAEEANKPALADESNPFISAAPAFEPKHDDFRPGGATWEDYGSNEPAFLSEPLVLAPKEDYRPKTDAPAPTPAEFMDTPAIANGDVRPHSDGMETVSANGDRGVTPQQPSNDGPPSTFSTEPDGYGSKIVYSNEPEAVDPGPARTPSSAAKKPAKVVDGPGQAIVTAPFGVKLRRAPRTDSEVLLIVAVDTMVRIINEESDKGSTMWKQIIAEGTTGWVSCAFIRRLPGGS